MDDVKNVRRPVYPRWRGEHRETGQNAFQCCGLSPLARGTPVAEYMKGRSARFIPAGAGNTLIISSISELASVYPRWRGEH